VSETAPNAKDPGAMSRVLREVYLVGAQFILLIIS